jgi:multidrug resistance protein
MGSSLPSGGVEYISKAFGVTNHTRLVLLNSLYMVGYVTGPPIWGPMSESVGRKPVLIGTYIGYCLFTMACALAPNYAALLICRLICGVFAAAANAVPGAMNADIYTDVSTRGQAMSLVMYITTFGPQCGPILSGWISPISWRWTFWTGLLLAAPGIPMMLLLPETYVPVLMARRRHQQRAKDEENGEKRPASTIARTSKREIYARPFLMLYHEPIVLFTSLYLALIYGVLYLFFQAFPLVFQGEPSFTTRFYS